MAFPLGALRPYHLHDGTSKRALVIVEFLGDDNTWKPIQMQVDTAADISVLPFQFARSIKWIGMQRPVPVREVVGSVTTLQTTARARIVGKEINLPIITSNFILDPLLGVAAFLDNFVLTLTPQGFDIRPVY